MQEVKTPSAGNAEGLIMEKQTQHQEDSTAQVEGQESVPLWTWEEVLDFTRSSWCEGVAVMYEATKDVLPQNARDGMTNWYTRDFSRFRHNYTDNQPAPPRFQIQNKEG